MKIKCFTIAAFMLFSLDGMAQGVSTDIPNLDLEEDTTDVTSVNDILKMQQKVVSNNSSDRHVFDVWRRKTFFNVSYSFNTMTSKDPVDLGSRDKLPTKELSFKSDWGLSIQAGHNYQLHKNQIANMVGINLDFSWLDLNVAHYKTEPLSGNYCYTSTVKNANVEGKEYNYFPWCLGKYEADYGMNIGPSVTVAPFVPMSNKILDFIKVNAYFHLGYSVSFLFVKSKKECDIAEYPNDEFNRTPKFQWGLGMYTSFGFNVSWKFIGLGFEHRSGSYGYKSIDTDTFGSDKTKFKLGTNRIYLTFKM